MYLLQHQHQRLRKSCHLDILLVIFQRQTDINNFKHIDNNGNPGEKEVADCAVIGRFRLKMINL